MKKLFFTALMFISMMLQAQNEIVYDEVVIVDSASQFDLSNRANQWVTLMFNGNRNSIEKNANGDIVVKGSVQYKPVSLNGAGVVVGRVGFTINILAKEGRYRYVINNITHVSSNLRNGVSLGLLTNEENYPWKVSNMYGENWYNKKWIEIKTQSLPELELLIASLKSHMVQKSIKEDNW